MDTNPENDHMASKLDKFHQEEGTNAPVRLMFWRTKWVQED